jgi:hypothetical protein
MSNQTTQKDRFIRMATGRWSFALFLLKAMPSAFFSKVRIRSLNEEECMVSVPCIWFTRNPFRSTYFACLAMAGEMSTGTLAMLHVRDCDKKVSMLVTEMEAKYHKKAREVTWFLSKDGRLIQAAVQYAAGKGQPQTCKAYTVGIDKEGNCIAEFWITWSFKIKT